MHFRRPFRIILIIMGEQFKFYLCDSRALDNARFKRLSWRIAVSAERKICCQLSVIPRRFSLLVWFGFSAKAQPLTIHYNCMQTLNYSRFQFPVECWQRSGLRYGYLRRPTADEATSLAETLRPGHLGQRAAQGLEGGWCWWDLSDDVNRWAGVMVQWTSSAFKWMLFATDKMSSGRICSWLASSTNDAKFILKFDDSEKSSFEI